MENEAQTPQQNSLTSDSQPILATLIPQLGFTHQRRSRKPPHVKQAVLAKAMIGTSNNQIAKDLDIDPSTVKAILNSSQIQEHVQHLRSDMVLNGDLVKSVRVMRQKLNKGSESAATTILRGFNVLQSNPKVEINIANIGAQSYAQRMMTKQLESETAPVEGKTIEVQPESSK
jgi:hypothetical protein